ncbi:MAG: Y-family DNA polymerase [Bacteroidaceae bacterium]|nr:Y-family DNA polymerase [Bacteroidaceae bacterium]
MMGVVDCNNFYVSCERVFRPDLRREPVVVLSNNDGCIIARSNEAKAMGITMGQPFFQVRHLVEQKKLHVFSANFALYGDMSRRVMSVVRSELPEMEIYSIDETFVRVDDDVPRLQDVGINLSKKVERWTGIPVSIGFAPSKTLAKMASKFAKKYAGYKGCCVIDNDEKKEKALSLFPIQDVWGIGRRYGNRLACRGVKTAADFVRWDEKHVRSEFGLPGIVTWTELKGIPCEYLEMDVNRKTITNSRSFKNAISDLEELKPIVADFAALCAQQLRKQHGAATDICVFIRTNPHQEEQPQYANSANVRLDVPTSDLREIIGAALRGLECIFRPNYAYKKAGVTVSNIVNGCVPGSLFDSIDRDKQEKLLKSLDSIHQKMGKDAVKVAIQGESKRAANRKYTSPAYTTNLNEIIEVKIL